MDPTLAVTLGVALLALGGTVVTAVLTYRASKQATSTAERANRDNALLKWAERLEASERAARVAEEQSRTRADRIKDEAEAEVDEIRAQVASLKDELRKATEQATRLTDRLTMAQVEVWRPEPDISALRRLLGRPGGGGANGRSL